MSLPLSLMTSLNIILLIFYLIYFFEVHSTLKKHRRRDALLGMLSALAGVMVILTYDERPWMKATLTMFLLLILIPALTPRKTRLRRSEGMYFRIHFCGITFCLAVLCMPLLKPAAIAASTYSWAAPPLIIGLLLVLTKGLRKMRRHAQWVYKLKEELQPQKQQEK